MREVCELQTTFGGNGSRAAQHLLHVPPEGPREIPRECGLIQKLKFCARRPVPPSFMSTKVDLLNKLQRGTNRSHFKQKLASP